MIHGSRREGNVVDLESQPCSSDYRGENICSPLALLARYSICLVNERREAHINGEAENISIKMGQSQSDRQRFFTFSAPPALSDVVGEEGRVGGTARPARKRAELVIYC